MDEHLLGYSLGALDPATQARVEAHLRVSPQARRCLAMLEEALEPLAADAVDPLPPPGLAWRTLARTGGRATLPAAPAPLPLGPPRHRLRRADGAVAAALLLLVGGLGMPLLARSWQTQQRAACANTMRQIHASLTGYADLHDGALPTIEATGPRAVAGAYVPTLRDAGLLSGQVACPGHGEAATTSLADLDALYRNDPVGHADAARRLAGGYAYSLGYVDDAGRLAGLRRNSGDTLPLLADAPGETGNSPNHGGCGQNVLFVGGHVRWCGHPGAGVGGDDIYVNHHRRVSAGVCRQDSVLGAGDARPYAVD